MQNFNFSICVIAAIALGLSRGASAADLAKNDRAELGAVMYRYNMGDSVAVSIVPNQHVICDSCPKNKRLAEFREPIVARLKLNEMKTKPPGNIDPSSNVSQAIQVAVPIDDPQEKLIATIQFNFDSARLSKKSIAELAGVAEKIKGFGPGEVFVGVDGYTCKIGKKRYNDKLAMRRAKAVAGQLKKLGVTVSRLTGEGVCCYVDGQRLEPNRRAEIYKSRKTGGK